MKRGTYITLLLFFLFPALVLPQQFIYKNYSVQDGLVANSVRRIFQDANGFIWIATLEGLSKYDGYKFTNYTIANGLSHNMVNDLFETADGKILVAENNGDIDMIQPDGIVSNRIFHGITINKFYISADKKVLAGTDGNGIYELINGTIQKPSLAQPANSFGHLTEWNDSVLAGGMDGFLGILNKKYEVLASINKTESFVNCLFADSKRRLWLGSPHGLKLFSASWQKNNRIELAPLPPSFNIPILSANGITAIYEDQAENFWIATSLGVVKLQPGGRWQVFSEKEGLPSNQVTCVFQDKENNIWIGTSLGLSKLITKNHISVFTTVNGLLSNIITDLYPLDNDQLLVNTSAGLQLYNKRDNRFLIIPDEKKATYSFFVKGSMPPMLGSTSKNLIGIYDSSSKRTVNRDAIPFFTGINDSKNNIIVGAQDGILCLSGKQFHHDRTFPYRINNLVIDNRDFLWAGTWNNGLYRIRYSLTNNKMSLVSENVTRLINAKEIRCLFKDHNGNIWVGTRYDGLFCILNDEQKKFPAKHWDYRQSLSSNWIGTLAEDADGNIWAGSYTGIDKLVRNDTGYSIFNFSRVFNLHGGSNSIITETGNRLWVTIGGGLVSITDEKLEYSPPLPVYISSILLGPDKNSYAHLQKEKIVQLNHQQNQVQFEFSAPGFINEKQILYSYRLAGSANSHWSTPSNTHTVSYASLQPGHYRFEVRTQGWNGSYSPPAFFEFLIQPPFWKTWWFIAICSLIAGFLIYLVYRYRINQLVKLQQVRNRIATDLHDDIGSSLTNISILTELSTTNLHTQPEKAQTFIQRIAEEVNDSSQALDDIVWSINTNNDSFEQIALRMRRYTAEVFDGGGIRYSLEMDDQLAHRKLKMEQRRDLFLIFKEAINNIYKHANPLSVVIKLWIEKQQLILTISDDGVGFDPTTTTSRNGLKNIRQRVAKWKGKIHIDSAPGDGSSIRVSFPVS